MVEYQNKRVSKLKTHVIVWASFIAYEILIVKSITDEFPSLMDSFVHYFINICLFYFHAHVLLPYLFRNKKIGFWFLPIGVLIEVVLYIGVVFFVRHGLSFLGLILENVSNWNDKTNIIKAVWRSIYFIGFSTGYYFLITFIKEKEYNVQLERQRLNQIIRQQEIEQELAKAQNAYLRAQINPHFLFNTLNFIYNRSRKTAPVAADAILTLSAMMRYAIDSVGEKGDILIADEIEQVGHLVHLHKLRQNEQIYFDIHANEQVKKIRLIPLVLITLVENIFKHGNLSLSHHPATLEIKMEAGTLHIHTDNLINAIHNNSGFSKGLENIGKRLDHAYGSAASFRYETDARNHFKTYVDVKLVHLMQINVNI